MRDVQDGGGAAAAAAAAGAAAGGGEGGLHSSMIGRKHNEEYEFMRKGVELAETMQEEVAVAEGGAWPAVLPKTRHTRRGRYRAVFFRKNFRKRCFSRQF